MHLTVYYEQLECIQLLLDAGAAVNAVNEARLLCTCIDVCLALPCVPTVAQDGETPLHWAAWLGQREMVQLLLDRGAVDAEDDVRAFCLMFF